MIAKCMEKRYIYLLNFHLKLNDCENIVRRLRDRMVPSKKAKVSFIVQQLTLLILSNIFGKRCKFIVWNAIQAMIFSFQ